MTTETITINLIIGAIIGNGIAIFVLVLYHLLWLWNENRKRAKKDKELFR